VSQSEKRYDPRQPLEIPLWFQIILLESDLSDISSKTANISRGGLFLRSPLRLKIGSQLSMKLRVPTAISGSARAFIHSLGEVVHERLLPDGLLGYGIRLTHPFRQVHIPPLAPALAAVYPSGAGPEDSRRTLSGKLPHP